ncbi:MAG: hypothetical protein DWQ02_19300 [Bacteroidetes bacterium]|nr:MAG: hypothetical protein DWQ02_19300 [Bacteroidota bacterium]
MLYTVAILPVFGQEHESVLIAPENWQSEIILFPISFAPEIDLTGFEDLRFAPGWADSTSQEFWTYTFVWYVDEKQPMTESKLTEYFNYYYDGLMGVDRKNKADTTNSVKLDKTLCLFIQSKEGFSGKMRVYDNFFTKDYLILNIKVKESFCPEMKKHIISCEISPKPFDHSVWAIFENVKLKKECK